MHDLSSIVNGETKIFNSFKVLAHCRINKRQFKSHRHNTQSLQTICDHNITLNNNELGSSMGIIKVSENTDNATIWIESAYSY